MPTEERSPLTTSSFAQVSLRRRSAAALRVHALLVSE